MIDEIKILLGVNATNFTDAQIGLCLKQAIIEVKAYTKRETLDEELTMLAEQIAIIRLNRLNTEGIASQNFGGASESYINEYPDNILKVLNRKRLIKVI